MSDLGIPPVVHRALVAVAVFTFVSWVLIAAALLVGAPGRGFAANAVARAARAATATTSAAPLAAVAMSDLIMPCGVHTFYSDDGEAAGFGWGLLDANGTTWIQDGMHRSTLRQDTSGAPRFWFRDHDETFVVRDPVLVAEVSEAARPLRELSHQMSTLGSEMGRQAVRIAHSGLRERSTHAVDQQELSHRMSELSAHHRELMRDVREKVRAIAERARREGKAERPHANA